MLTKNKGVERYNDGVVYIYRPKVTNNSDFAASINVKGVEDMRLILKLCFEERNRRQQDVEYAEQKGFTLSRKIKTRKVEPLGVKCKAVINRTLYDISDIDFTQTEAFLYLTEVRRLDT